MRKAENVTPVPESHIGINFHNIAPAVQAVITILTRPRDPFLVARLNVKVIRLESTSLQALEGAPLIVKRLARLGLLPVLDIVTRPIRAGPLNPAALHSMYMMRVFMQPSTVGSFHLLATVLNERLANFGYCGYCGYRSWFTGDSYLGAKFE